MLPELFRRLPLLSVYLVLILASTVTQLVWMAAAGGWTPPLKHFYWTTDVLHKLVVYAALIDFTCRFLTDRPKVAGWLLSLALAFLTAGAILWHLPDQAFNLAMTMVGRDLSFAGAILVMAMWLPMMGRRWDPKIVAILVGFGLELTGGAIGHAMRSISRSWVFSGNMLMLFTHLGCLYLWWQALRHWRSEETSTFAIAPFGGTGEVG